MGNISTSYSGEMHGMCRKKEKLFAKNGSTSHDNNGRKCNHIGKEMNNYIQ